MSCGVNPSSDAPVQLTVVPTSTVLTEDPSTGIVTHTVHPRVDFTAKFLS